MLVIPSITNNFHHKIRLVPLYEELKYNTPYLTREVYRDIHPTHLKLENGIAFKI